MVAHADAIDSSYRRGVSARVRDELDKLPLADCPGVALRLLRDVGALGRILPEFAPCIGFDQESRYHALTADEHSHPASSSRSPRPAVRPRPGLGAFFHDIGKPSPSPSWRRDGRAGTPRSRRGER